MNVTFPSIRWDARQTVVAGQRIATVSFWTDTHRGEFLGIPATGRRVTVRVRSRREQGAPVAFDVFTEGAGDDFDRP